MQNTKSPLIQILNCNIENKKGVLMPQISWQMQTQESWLVTGQNGGGKADFVNALNGNLSFVPIPSFSENNAKTSIYSNVFCDSVEVVSLERAAKLIQEERENDESEYVEGGVDVGRTGRIFIAQALVKDLKKNSELPEIAKRLETLPEIKLCGVQNILDRGLKYMSTGEIRRTLLARALISKKKLLVLSDPFAGLDKESRTILLEFFNTISSKQNSDSAVNSTFPRIVLVMERYAEIPESITNVLEFTDKKISFCGTKTEYEKILNERKIQNAQKTEQERKEFANAVKSISSQVDKIMGIDTSVQIPETLIQMKNVNVGWGEKQVLKDLTWSLKKGEHWLIRGPNGSGKTTFLELITGNNGQVFCNDVSIFGRRRGTGETIWEIKHKLGIVSYRLHVEYRMVNSSLLNVIISGFHDSIGLYQAATDLEIDAAKKWLELAGFKNRENEMFNNLSYGEQRAVLILRAAVKCPPILILDEPCHGLDENFRQKILDLLEIIAESKTTTILHVTHEPSEVLECEKHILELIPEQTPMYRIIEL